jgi:ABC-type nitrate/sulfonate/bicarbonate transport system substrate-binding protein
MHNKLHLRERLPLQAAATRRAHPTRSRAALLSMVAATTLVATACGSSSGGTTQSAGKTLTNVRFQFDWLPTSGDLPVLAAQKFGWFEEEGLKVTTVPGGPETNPIQLVSTGQKDIGISGAVAVLQVHAKSAPVTAVGLIQPKDPAGLICNPNKGLDPANPKSLEGHSIGIQDNSFYNSLVETWLTKKGVDRSKVKEIVVGSDPVVMFAGKVDCFPDFLTLVPVKAEQYFHKPATLFSIDDIGSIAQLVIANNSFMKEHPEQVRGFVTAYAKGMQWALRHQDEAIDLVTKSYPSLAKDVVKVEAPALMKYWVSDAQRQNGLMWMDTAEWQPVYQALEGTSFLPKPLNVNEVFTTAFLPTPPIMP